MKLNSEKNTILVLSDIHQDIYRAERILKTENYDIAVCLGDWFDSFVYNTTDHTVATCKFLSQWIDRGNFFTLFGNHDVHYLFDNPTFPCSGYTTVKHDAIKKFYKKSLAQVRDKFLWYMWIDDYLCSHAGINKIYIPNIPIEHVDSWLALEVENAKHAVKKGGPDHWFFHAGFARGGYNRAGGLVWQDFDCEFEPIDGIKQLVGHTPHAQILPPQTYWGLDYTESSNLDIDCHLNQYLKIFNKKLTIHNYSDL